MKNYLGQLEAASLVFGLMASYSYALPTTDSILQYSPFTPRSPSQKILSNYLQPCHKRQKRFNLCVKTTLQTFFSSVAKGSREIPSIEPLKVQQMEITEGSGDVSLNLKFRDVSILGLRSTKVISVRSNLEDNKLEITMKYPYLNILGQYSGEGRVNTLPLVGTGDFSFNMTDVSAAWIIYLGESNDLSGKHLVIDQFLIDIIPVEISAKFGEAIDDDNALGAAINGFFNANSQEIFKLTKPKVADALSKVFTSFANNILSQFSVNALLPP